MDAISPEYRLTVTGPGSFQWCDWQIDETAALMLHEPSRAVFSIYIAPGSDAEALSIYQLRARLAHVCDGFPLPRDIAALAASAMNAFAMMTERLNFVELRDDGLIPF